MGRRPRGRRLLGGADLLLPRDGRRWLGRRLIFDRTQGGQRVRVARHVERLIGDQRPLILVEDQLDLATFAAVELGHDFHVVEP